MKITIDEIHNILNTRLRATGIIFELTNEFRELKTDEKRIVFALNVIRECDVVPNTTGMPKNAEESEKLRKNGNIVFAKGILSDLNCLVALKLYTSSIAFAPSSSEQLALGYANRSAALYQFGLYLECIQDIDRALALNYPENLRAKLYLRKTECLMHLRNPVEDMLEKAQYWLERMSLNDTNREKLKTKVDVLRNKIAQTGSHTTNTETKTVESALPTIESCNDEVSCASDAVAIKYNERYGRHVVATRNIHPGEVIVVEEPYSLMLTPENMESHCSNCLKVCWANIPCNYCSYAMYCSEECRTDEWKKCHDIECTVFPILAECDFYKLDFFSIRLAVLALREAGGIKELRTMLKEVDKHADPRTKGFSQDGKLHSDRYIGVYSLERNTEKRSVSDLFRRSVDAALLVYYLATRTMIFGAKLPGDLNALMKNNDVTFFGSLILKHQQIIPVNMHTFGESLGLEHIERGIAAMPFLSLINHSCDPNIIRHSRPKHIVVYAMYPIRKGEQLLENYGTHYAVMPRAVRQQKLLKQYHFICDCIPCQEDWPIYLGLESYKTLVTRREDKAKIKKALRKFNTYVDLATEGNVQNNSSIIKDLLKMVQVLHDCAPMPCQEMNNVVETLKRMYDMNGNIYEIPQIRK